MFCFPEKNISIPSTSPDYIEQARIAKTIANARTICIVSALVLGIVLIVLLSAQLAFLLPLSATIVLFSMIACSLVFFLSSLFVCIRYIQNFLKLATQVQDKQLSFEQDIRTIADESRSEEQSTVKLEDELKKTEDYLASQLNCTTLYKHLLPRQIDDSKSQVVIDAFFFILSKVSSLMEKEAKGDSLLTGKEITAMFLPAFFNTLNHPILGPIEKLDSLFQLEESGPLWLSQMLLQESFSHEHQPIVIDRYFALINLFLTGWCLSSSKARELVTSSVKNLNIDNEHIQQILNYLDQNDVLSAIMHSCQCRQVACPITCLSKKFKNYTDSLAICKISMPLISNTTKIVSKLQNFLVKLMEAMPSTFASLGFQLRKNDNSPVSLVFKEMKEYLNSELQAGNLEHPYTTVAVFIRFLIICYQNKKLLLKLKKFLSGRTAPVLVQAFSILAKGMLAAGMFTNQLINDLSQAIKVSDNEIIQKINDGSLVSMIMNTIL